MKNYKAIILGPQCSGKTTLAKYFREHHTSLPIVEEDEIFVDLNNSTYPTDIRYKEKVLRPKLEEKIKQSDDIIFLTSYCNPILIKDLKSRGFKIIQLVLEREEFDKRNKKRMEEEGYDDANEWAKEVFDFHQKVQDEGLVDKRIDTNRPTEAIAREILDFLE